MTGKDMSQARAPKTCEVCGREITANNYSRHLKTHSNGNGQHAAPARKRTKKTERTGRQQTIAVGRYLDMIADGGRFAGSVSLGALAGFPTHTDDPDVVEAAADSITARADEAGTRVVEIKLRQRAANLRSAAQDLRDTESGEDPEAAFIAVGAEWAEQNEITYEVFREMGVPARVLKEAGIGR